MTLKTTALVLLGLSLPLGCLAATAASPSEPAGSEEPNIVLLFIDDWAWNGSPLRMDDAMPNSAIASGTRKVMHFCERPDLPMLFDLNSDEGEVENIATQHPEEHKALYREMMRYFEEVEARLPKVNPDYDLEFYQQTKEYDPRVNWGPFEGNRALDDDEKQAAINYENTLGK